MDQFGFIGRCHDDEVGQGAQIGDVERSRMGRAVRANEASPVDGKAHGQVLDRHVMHHLIEGALQERRVDRAERPHAFGRKASGERHCVLLGNADIEAAGRMPLCELVDPGARRHRRGDRDDAAIAVGEVRQRLAEHVLVLRRARCGLALLAGDDVELGDAMILVGGSFRRAVAVTLFGDDMDQARAFRHIAHILEHRDQRLEIVAIDGPDIVEAQLLEQRPAHRHAAGIFIRLVGRIVQGGGQFARNAPGKIAQLQKRPRAYQPREVCRQAPHRRRDRHVVVVEHDDQPVAGCFGVVHRLIGHARRHRPVADHRDAAAGPVRKLRCHGKAERRRDRGG